MAPGGAGGGGLVGGRCVGPVGRAATVVEEVQAAVKRWPEFAAAAKLSDEWRDKIQKTHRLEFPEK